MEPKNPIIIDGVDVSGCEWYTQGVTGMICADWHISNDCCKNPNCYYKQLKRKEQECEELKEKIKYMEEYIKTVENSRNEFDKESKINGKIEYDIKSDMIAQEEKKKIKRSECPYGGIDCAWCLEDCE